MELVFDEGGCTGDFNAVCDPPDYWKKFDPDGEDELEIWFRAYTTQHELTPSEATLRELGYGYECFVEVSTRRCFNDVELARFRAKDRAEAERLLQLAANAIYGEE